MIDVYGIQLSDLYLQPVQYSGKSSFSVFFTEEKIKQLDNHREKGLKFNRFPEWKILSEFVAILDWFHLN